MRILTRHNGGGNILHFDGSVTRAKLARQLRIEYWEPDYDLWKIWQME